MDFAEKLIIFRKKYKLSQKTTADILNIEQRSVSRYENRKVIPNKAKEYFYNFKMEEYEKIHDPE